MIPESEIEKSIIKFADVDASIDSLIDDRLKGQDDLYYYLFQDDTNLLLEEEKSMHIFICSVIIDASFKGMQQVIYNREKIIKLDEKNWQILEDTGFTKNIRDRFTPYFEDSNEEDLLAFVEDLLMDDDGKAELSDTGRNIIMVKSKTLIDLISSR